MKKSTPRPLTPQPYTAQPPYAIPGTAQQRHPSVGLNGTPLRRYRRGKVLVVICHAAPGCSRTRRGDDRHDRVEPAVDSSATGAGSTRPHADQPAGAGGGGPGGAGPGAALRRRLASSTSLALVPAASARWDWCMTPGELAAVRRRLEEFAAEVFASLARHDTPAK